MSSIAISLGAGSAVRGAAGAPPPVLSVTGTADGEIEIDAGTGALTVTITAPSHYAGTYSTDVTGAPLGAAAMASGPQCLVAPRIRLTGDTDASGTVTEGDAVGIGTPHDAASHPGLWIYDTVNGVPTIGYSWQADTGGNGVFTDLADATATTFAITSAEAGDDLRLVETATDAGGGRSVASAPLGVVAPAPAASFDFTGAGNSGLGGAASAGPFTVSGLSFGAEDVSREIWAVVSAPGQLSASQAINGVSIGGVPATRVAGTTASTGYGYIEVWKAALPSGTSGNVIVTTDGAVYGALVALYRAVGKRPSSTPASEGTATGAASVAAGIATAPGDTVLTAAWNFNGNGLSLAGVVPDFAAYDFRTGDFFVAGRYEASAVESPRSVSASSPSTATVFNILSITIEDNV